MLNSVLSFYADVYYIFKHNVVDGIRVNETFMPHHKSYSLAVFVGLAPGLAFEKHVFVDQLVFNTLSINTTNVCEAIVEKIKNFNKLDKKTTVVVFDLDDTIINENYGLLTPNLNVIVKAIAEKFDYCVLWSHGIKSHVKTGLTLHKLNFWDLVIHRPFDSLYDKNKSLGYVLKQLNSMYDVSGITFSCLFDDLADNNAGEYDKHYLIPLDKSKKFYNEYYLRAIKELDVYLDKCNNSF